MAQHEKETDKFAKEVQKGVERIFWYVAIRNNVEPSKNRYLHALLADILFAKKDEFTW